VTALGNDVPALGIGVPTLGNDMTALGIGVPALGNDVTTLVMGMTRDCRSMFSLTACGSEAL
jgi:tartrate dehydratase alpha subunit/fumarate hydratase class I-like protein